MTRSLFDPLVEAYDAARPSYPPELFDALDRLGGPLDGALVVEVGAGTGIATRALLDRGAVVLAADIGTAMLTRLLTRLRTRLLARTGTGLVGAVLADGHRLPLPDGVADLVCYAQAWHWMDPPSAAAEAVRVLRPGGVLACWWNDVDADDAAWWQAQQDRLEAANPTYTREYRDTDYRGQLLSTGHFCAVDTAEFRWTRELTLDHYETWLRSKSYVAALGSGLWEFLAAERASLAAAFPDGTVREPFLTRLVVGRSGPAPE